jgi:hypothetical protein
MINRMGGGMDLVPKEMEGPILVRKLQKWPLAAQRQLEFKPKGKSQASNRKEPNLKRSYLILVHTSTPVWKQQLHHISSRRPVLHEIINP